MSRFLLKTLAPLRPPPSSSLSTCQNSVSSLASPLRLSFAATAAAACLQNFFIPSKDTHLWTRDESRTTLHLLYGVSLHHLRVPRLNDISFSSLSQILRRLDVIYLPLFALNCGVLIESSIHPFVCHQIHHPGIPAGSFLPRQIAFDPNPNCMPVPKLTHLAPGNAVFLVSSLGFLVACLITTCRAGPVRRRVHYVINL